MLIYIAIYLFFICIAVLFNVTPNFSISKKKIYLFVTFGIMFILQALRADTVAADTKAYINIFESIKNTHWKILTNQFNYEFGYIILNKLISILCVESQFLLTVVSFIIMLGFAYLFYLESSNIYLSTIFFLGLNHFFTSMSSLRQYIALMFAMYAYFHMQKRRYAVSILFMLLSFLFHQTVIVFNIALIGIMLLKPIKSTIVLFVIIEIIILSFYKYILNIFIIFFPKYQYYLTDSMLETETGIGEIRICFILIEVSLLLLLFINKKYATAKNVRLASLISISITIGLLQKYVPYIWRLIFYFDFLLLLLIPGIIEKKKINKQIYIVLCVIGASAYFVYLLFHNSEVVPYRTYF